MHLYFYSSRVKGNWLEGYNCSKLMVSPLLQLACPAAEWALRTAVCCAEVGPLAFCSIGLHCEQDQSLLRWVWQGALVPVPVALATALSVLPFHWEGWSVVSPAMYTCPARKNRKKKHFKNDENEMCIVISLWVGEKSAGECLHYTRDSCKAAERCDFRSSAVVLVLQ